MMTKATTTTHDGLRRKPQQTRGQQRVEAILAAAETVLGEVGYEAATTNQIAARAGIPIGSLYQFFSNKQAILAALIDRQYEALAGAIQNTVGQSQNMSVGQIVDALIGITPIMSAGRSPLMRLCMEAPPNSPLYEASDKIRRVIFEVIVALIQRFAPQMSEADCQLHARISQAAWQATLSLYVRELDEGQIDIANQILAQGKVLQTAYFERVFALGAS